VRRLIVLAAAISVSLVLLSPSIASATTCTVTVNTETDITNEIVAASPGDTVCVASGSYGAVLLGGNHANWVYLRPATGASVTFSSLQFSWSSHYIDVAELAVSGIVDFDGQNWLGSKSSHVRLHSMHFGYAVLLRAGQDSVQIDHNTFSDSPGNAISIAGDSETPVTNTTVDYNVIDSPHVDGIYAAYYDTLEIEWNEITGLSETGEHSDAFQSSGGGSDLLYNQNYLHDFCGQGFFIKDGHVDGVRLYNNLIVRNVGTGNDCGAPINVQDASDLDIRRNTVWDNEEGSVVQGPDTDNVDVINNQLEYFLLLDDDGVPDGDASNTWYDPVAGEQRAGMVYEDYNILGGGWAWSDSGRAGVNDVLSLTSGFTWEDASHTDDNYRLNDPVVYADSSEYDTGVSWVPGDWSVGS
jgi:parallel beta helix pectate lyase-like protein